MLSSFAYTLILSLVISVAVVYLSKKYNFFIDDSTSNEPQKFHTRPTPRAGGIGILVGMSMLLTSLFGLKFILSALFAFSSGIFEDFHNSLSPRRRLFLQIIAASVAIWLTDSVVTYLGLGITLPYWAGVLFSVFAIVGMMNAVNIIDGFNGLASGVIILILISFAIVSHSLNNEDLLQAISIISGSTLGFFIVNFPKGKIFLGDGGAYLLGFSVALIGILLASNYEAVSPWYVLAIFIYPVWEVVFSIIRKLSIGLSPMQPDNQHMHMLIHKHITKNNPLTSVFIWSVVLPFVILSTIYASSSIANICISLVFVVSYLSLYRYLFSKES
jgi:UDP-N-acetylmuramyl pentapeptide phosphotransferase/UDP-N-acetylglucosamine-1-phosphate transferase